MFDPRLVRRFTPLALGDIARLPDPEWLVEGHLPLDALALLYGPPHSFKSFLALDWALSVSLGLPWLGQPTRHVPVAYIYAEGARGLRQRVAAWLTERSLDFAAPALFSAVPCPVNIVADLEFGSLCQAVKQAGVTPGLIVLDTIARNFGDKNENATQDMNAFVAACDRFRVSWPGATVLLVHHTGKDAERGARGSVALLGATDAAFEMKNRNGSFAELHNPRQKDSEEQEARVLGFPTRHGACVCIATDRKIRKGRPGEGGEDKAWETLFHLQAAHGGGVRYQAWQDAAGLPEKSFKRARAGLLEAGRVEKLDDGTYTATLED